MSYAQTFSDLKKNKEGALVAFSVIGFPSFEKSVAIAKALIKGGADILELGLPFSDPIADGPTIQEADQIALRNGFTTPDAFTFVKEIRKYSEIPIGFLVYYNLVLQYGVEAFYKAAAEAGVNSVLIADMPLEEIEEVEHVAKKYNVEVVLMVTPLTDDDRVKKIVSKASGFVYVVTRLGITGAQEDLQDSTIALLKRIRKHTDQPLCAGFGISKPEHVKAVIQAGADGAIVGSGIVKTVSEKDKAKMLAEVKRYVAILKEATEVGVIHPNRRNV